MSANMVRIMCPYHLEEEIITWPYGNDGDVEIACGRNSNPRLINIELKAGQIIKVKKAETSSGGVPSEEEMTYREWNEARESVARFDNILVDLRKYGFSLVTILIGA